MVSAFGCVNYPSPFGRSLASNGKIIPNVVKEIIKKEGVLASCNDEHVAKLEDWLKDCFVSLLIDVLKEKPR